LNDTVLSESEAFNVLLRDLTEMAIYRTGSTDVSLDSLAQEYLAVSLTSPLHSGDML